MTFRDTVAWTNREERQARDAAAAARRERSRAQAKALAEGLKDIERVRTVTVIGPDGRMADGTPVDDIGTDPSKWPRIVDLSKYRK